MFSFITKNGGASRGRTSCRCAPGSPVRNASHNARPRSQVATALQRRLMGPLRGGAAAYSCTYCCKRRRVTRALIGLGHAPWTPQGDPLGRLGTKRRAELDSQRRGRHLFIEQLLARMLNRWLKLAAKERYGPWVVAKARRLSPAASLTEIIDTWLFQLGARKPSARTAAGARRRRVVLLRSLVPTSRPPERPVR